MLPATFIRRTAAVALLLAGAVAVYALLGFLALPYFAQRGLTSLAADAGHRLELKAVRFNPFTLAAELVDFELTGANGDKLLAAKRLLIDVAAASLLRGYGVYDAIVLDAPVLHGELRADGRHNFSALIDAIRARKTGADDAPLKLDIGSIEIADGRLELADRNAGEHARLTLAPLAFRITALTTETSDRAPYRLTASTPEGETLEWDGDVSLEPLASHGRVALRGLRAETLRRVLGNRLGLARVSGRIDASGRYNAAYGTGKATLDLSGFELKGADLVAVGRHADEPLLTLAGLHLGPASIDVVARRASIERLLLTRPRASVAVTADASVNWSGLAAAGTPDAQAPAQDSAGEGRGKAPPWQVRLAQLLIEDGGLAFLDRATASPTEATVSGLRLEAGVEARQDDGTFAVTLTAPRLATEALNARFAQHTLATGAIAASAKELAMRLTDTGADTAVAALAASVSAPTGGGQQAWKTTSIEAAAEQLRVAAARGQAPRVDASAITLAADGISGGTAGGGRHAVELKSISARAPSLSIVAGSALEVSAEGASAAVADLVLRDPAGGNELARAGQLVASGIKAAGAERRLELERVLLADAFTAVAFDAKGRSSWEAFVAAWAPPAPTAAPAVAEATRPWKATVQTVELRNLSAAYADARHEPALNAGVEQVSARLLGLSTERAAARLEVQGQIKDGGRFRASGPIDLQAPSSNLALNVEGVPLVPLQPFLARHARLRIASGVASLEGRLRYGMAKAAGATLHYEGAFGLDKLVLEETEPSQPFLALDSLRGAQAVFTLGPDRLEIGDLRVQGLASRLLIAEDQSVNVAKLARARAPAKEPAATNAGAGNEEAAFPIAISRIRIDDSRLDFADLSLRPQFSTRMHELQGVITGLSTAENARARMELDARVDEFGSAQIRGVLSLFRPQRFTDVTMVFRNLEMTALTPYTAKFAGYRIASGKLSMDLHYRLKNSVLMGENKIVVDKLELGERVESPTALDLPLELAIAILKDENGRIDIGLPVSGSLDDPQFSFGAIVWKALGNLFARIVTAPFRALARLFGGSENEDLGAIEFDPGATRLAPPERQKLQTVAAALAKRPELRLTVNGTYAAEADRTALQSLAVRRAVLRRAGIALGEGESPGPLDYGNARIRRAVEDLFTERFGFPAARDLRASLEKKAPQPAPDAPARAGAGADGASREPAAETTSAPPSASTRAARAMTQRLVESHPVDGAELNALAAARAERIATELKDGGKIASARILTAGPKSVSAREGGPVAVALELGIAN